MVTNIKKILIANRGEIALRVIRTAHEMGISTVAIYAPTDRNAQFVEMADEAYALSGDTYRDTYLNEDAILDIIKRSGTDAVHPGYGFLSEVASFAKKLTMLGLFGLVLVRKRLLIWEIRLRLVAWQFVRKCRQFQEFRSL